MHVSWHVSCRRHIVGASFLDLFRGVKNTPLHPRNVPDISEFEMNIRGSAVNEDDHVVIYESTGHCGFLTGARAWWMFKVQHPRGKGVLSYICCIGTFRPMGCHFQGPLCLNPFTPESDQCQNSPAASQEIWHHTVWRTWHFIAYSDEKWLYYKFSLQHSYNRFLKGWENTLFELRSERVKQGIHFHDFSCLSRVIPKDLLLTPPSQYSIAFLGFCPS